MATAGRNPKIQTLKQNLGTQILFHPGVFQSVAPVVKFTLIGEKKSCGVLAMVPTPRGTSLLPGPACPIKSVNPSPV